MLPGEQQPPESTPPGTIACAPCAPLPAARTADGPHGAGDVADVPAVVVGTVLRPKAAVAVVAETAAVEEADTDDTVDVAARTCQQPPRTSVREAAIARVESTGADRLGVLTLVD